MCVFLHELAHFSHCGPEGSGGSRYSRYNTWAGLGHLLAENPAQKKKNVASDAFAVFRLFLACRRRKICLHHRNNCVVAEKKKPHYLILLVHSQRLTLGAGKPLWSVERRRKSLLSLWRALVRSLQIAVQRNSFCWEQNHAKVTMFLFKAPKCVSNSVWSLLMSF